MHPLKIAVLLGMTLRCLAGQGPTWIPARLVSIDYPLLALQSRTEGVVKVECAIAPDGSVSTAKIASGSPLLGGAVLARIGEWRFRREAGAASVHPEATVTITFQFVLEKAIVVQSKTKFVFDYPDTATVISQPLRRTH